MNSNQARSCDLGFSANRMWLVSRLYIFYILFLHYYKARAFSIQTVQSDAVISQTYKTSFQNTNPYRGSEERERTERDRRESFAASSPQSNYGGRCSCSGAALRGCRSEGRRSGGRFESSAASSRSAALRRDQPLRHRHPSNHRRPPSLLVTSLVYLYLYTSTGLSSRTGSKLF